MEHQRDEIPENEGGVQKDLEHSYTAEDQDDADELFLIAKDNLLNVNQWHRKDAIPGAVFELTDHHGHPVKRKAHQGDYIRINIPGPGSKAGEGYDWVYVERITYDDYPDENTESIKMQLRPAQAPVNKHGEDIAHFFTSASTSTFIIERKDKILTAHYAGRNEKPNNETGNFVDNARNTLVAIGALLGLSELQWNGLIKGFLSFDEVD
jgi:hypothetical protein